MQKVKKRDGQLQDYQEDKIVRAILKAMKAGGQYSEKVAENVAKEITKNLTVRERAIPIADIESLVFNLLVKHGKKSIAKLYEGYRAIREYQRNADTDLEQQLAELLAGQSKYWQNENSNKNATLVTTQRDYMAGIVSKHIARKCIFPPDIVEAHDNGICHIHDLDYLAERTRTNCCLINLDDMLQNGTVLNGVSIDKPHRLITATTIATQIILGVSSSQYGLRSRIAVVKQY